MYPDTRICLQYKSCTVTVFLLRDSLYRDTALVPATNFVTSDKFLAPISFVPQHAYTPENFAMTPKTAPNPPFPTERNILLKTVIGGSAGIASGYAY
jgi:hypothetical protein